MIGPGLVVDEPHDVAFGDVRGLLNFTQPQGTIKEVVPNDWQRNEHKASVIDVEPVKKLSLASVSVLGETGERGE